MDLDAPCFCLRWKIRSKYCACLHPHHTNQNRHQHPRRFGGWPRPPCRCLGNPVERVKGSKRRENGNNRIFDDLTDLTSRNSWSLELIGGFYPSEKFIEIQLGLLFPIYGKIKAMFQTTNQRVFLGRLEFSYKHASWMELVLLVA